MYAKKLKMTLRYTEICKILDNFFSSFKLVKFCFFFKAKILISRQNVFIPYTLTKI